MKACGTLTRSQDLATAWQSYLEDQDACFGPWRIEQPEAEEALGGLQSAAFRDLPSSWKGG
jgi:hypothetical protein